MRPLPSSHRYNLAVKSVRLAVAAGTIAGLAVLASCADATKTVSSPVQSPRNSSITNSGGLAFAATIRVCVSATSPAGTYKFVNAGTLSDFEIGVSDATIDGADGGSGTSVPNVTDGNQYTVAVGGCVTTLSRTASDVGFPANGFSDTKSGQTIEVASTPPGVIYDHTDCVNELIAAIPDPCGTGNSHTRAYMNSEHGSQVTFFFVNAPVTGLIPLFVIGDLVPWSIETLTIKGNKIKGSNNTVNFWGSQWWKNNPMSQFHSNGWPSFKGYASAVNLTDITNDHPCGTWISRVGNSPPPPQTIPDLVGIIITNNVVKVGPDLGGGIQEIIVVHQDGGYGPNPGHDGNGPVVSIQCGGAR